MKILGFDIKRATTAAEPNLGSKTVSLEQANQKTLPSLPLKRSFPRAELGDSGTRTIHGIITEEYIPELQGIQGIKIYDEMRKSDGTVRAAMLACTLPIRRAHWFVNPATEDDQGKEIANFVEHALFDWLDITWDDVLRQALLMVPLGVMIFEKVYGVKDHDGKQYVTLQKLAPRLPKSVLQWELPDRTFGIQQIRQDGVLAMIPGSKLLTFVNEREGDNWWGNSMLRAAYKHWYYKNNFYKIDGVAFERQGMGVPYIKMPAGYTEADERRAVTAMQNLRANEEAYIVIPTDYEVGFLDMGARSTRDPNLSIGHHNREILKSVLAQFLELGSQSKSSGTGGSRSLSNDHSELFLKGLEAVANTLIGEINKNLIPELVDLNFDNISTYPVLDYAGIDKVDMDKLATAYSSLVTAGAITPTDDDQQYIRSALGLPARTQEDIDAAGEEESIEDLEDHRDIETNPNKKPAVVDTAVDNQKSKKQTKPQNKKTDAQVKKKKPVAKTEAHEHVPLPRKFDDGNGFMSWRPLTFAEQKVNWPTIQKTMDQMEADFTEKAKELLTKAKDAFVAKLHTAVDAGDAKAIADLELQFVAQYKEIVKQAMKDAYVYGKSNVSTEMGVATPPNSADSLANIDLLADTIARKTMGDLESKAKISSANALKTDTTAFQTIGAIDAALEEAITKAVNHTAGIIVGQSINNGRNDVFQRNRGMIYALQRSEVLDERTCEFCLSMDGLVVEPTDSWAATDVFHENCRGIWVEILIDEQDKPDVTGVPDELSDYYGGEPNALIQPKKAIVRDGSPAEAEVARRQAEKDAKKKK